MFRRSFLMSLSAPLVSAQVARAARFTRSSQRPKLGVIGCGSRWGWQLAQGGSYGVGPVFAEYGDYGAVCDVDRRRREAAAQLIKQWQGREVDLATEDYRELLARPDIDAILIFTPDHWHAKLAVEAMRAGKDVYCEKPLSLTIAEGRLLHDEAARTGRVVQVGTQQRSDLRFLTAVALVQAGRIGQLQRVTCGLGGTPVSPAIPTAATPPELNWDRWLGPAPLAPYRELAGAENETHAWSNNHYEFRWWYDYSGGKLTDWGAHHVDIAHWATSQTPRGPMEIIPEHVEHPVQFVDGFPVDPDRYNTATRFLIRARRADGLELILRDDARNGILFEGSEGRLFVSRGTLEGRPVEELGSRPLPEGWLNELYGPGTPPEQTERLDSVAHVRNFFEALAGRTRVVSDVASHHQALTICHLANIAARLGRSLRWDPEQESMVGDPQAEAFTRRPARAGYEFPA